MVLEQATPFTIFTVEVILIIIISLATGRSNTFSNIAFNGIITVMAGGTLLFDGKPTGFFLLIYGIFLMVFGIKEYEETKFLRDMPMIAKLLKVMGHYIIVSTIMLTVLAVEYLGFDITAYGSLLLPILAGLLLL